MILAPVALWMLAAAPAGAREPVSREALVAAMRTEQGYDRTTTTNQARFQARVLLRLAREARERRPDGPPLSIGYEDWFRAYLLALGLQETQAPLPVRLTYQHGQDLEIEHRPERVVRRVRRGPVPSLALNVVWTFRRGEDRRYSYEDKLSKPELKVTIGRTVRYRLLEQEGLLLYDEIEGVWGRPTTGLLALLFQLIGEAQAVSSRIGIAPDGWQVVHARGRKGIFGRSATITVRPDGVADKDVPPERKDLEALAARLKQPVEIEYVPWE